MSASVSYTHLDVYKRQPIPKRGKTPGKLSFLRFQKIRGMDFLGNILAVHLVQDILERGNVVVIPQGVDAVIHGDIADTVSWEKVLNQMPGLQIITPQSAEVFRDDKVDLPALNGSQPVSYTHLDVYKRQIIQSIFKTDFTVCHFPSIQPLLAAIKNPLHNRILERLI